MEGLNRWDMLQPHGPLCIKLPPVLTGRQKLTYIFMMDPRLSTRNMTGKIIGMTSQAIFQAGASQSGTRERCACFITMWTSHGQRQKIEELFKRLQLSFLIIYLLIVWKT